MRYEVVSYECVWVKLKVHKQDREERYIMYSRHHKFSNN